MFQKITILDKGTIEYVYTASGVKLQKIVTDNSILSATTGTGVATITNYVNGFVYQKEEEVDEVLSFFAHEEGRYRPQTNQPGNWVADYFIKDHLGNVRMTLTEETQIVEHIKATLEDPIFHKEKIYFNNVEPVIPIIFYYQPTIKAIFKRLN